MTPIILASASPRRRELLALGGLDFEVRPADVIEIPRPGEDPGDFAVRMSAAKARAAARTAEPGAVVLAADTIVVVDEPEGSDIVGKPNDPPHAAALLRRLRGRPHRVLTGLAVLNTADSAAAGGEAPGVAHDLVVSRVPMRNYTDAEIDAYVATGDALDKAGAYAIQYGGFQPVDLDAFEDCFANVMGLPVCAALRLLQRAAPEAVSALPPLGDCHHFDPSACPVYARIDRTRGKA